MQKLKDLIVNVPGENYEQWFQAIAQLLFSEYLIETYNRKYQLTELEFYYHSTSHPDEATYGFIKQGTKYVERIMRHKLCQQQQLTWFFHYSGIDIVIGKKDEPGGILIRSIRDVETRENIKGPLVVYLELLNQNTAIDNGQPFQLKLTEVDTPLDYEMEEPKGRVGINSGNFEKALYNYSIK